MERLKKIIGNKPEGTISKIIFSNGRDKIASKTELPYQGPLKCEGDKTYNASGNSWVAI